MVHRIISRDEWGAKYDNGAGARKLPCRETWLHHSVSLAPDLLPPFEDDYAAVRDLEKIGESRFGRGISYTFLITPAGLIFEGHSVDRVGSHTSGRNTIASGICLIGNYDTKPPPEPMLDAVGWLLAHGFLAGWWDAVPLDGGHRDTKPTACPGRYAYADLDNINGRAKAYASATPPPEDDDMPPSPAIVNVGGVDFTFVKGTDNALHVHDGVGWTKLGGRLTSAPSATPAPDGMIHIAVRGDDGGSYLTVFNPADRTLGGWRPIGGKS